MIKPRFVSETYVKVLTLFGIIMAALSLILKAFQHFF